MTTKAAPPAPKGLTHDQASRLRGIASQLWHGEMGMEVMQMVAEEGKDSIPRSHVLEIVLDAGRFEQEVARQFPEASAWVAAASYKDLQKLIKPAFPYTRYGS